MAIFAFNRPRHLARCLESLAANPEASRSTGCLFLDGPRCGADEPLVEQVRDAALGCGVFARTVIVERGVKGN